MNDPDLIVLDEPTDGVDPVGRREIRDVLAGLYAVRGTTIFINSHLPQRSSSCSGDRVAILVTAGKFVRGMERSMSCWGKGDTKFSSPARWMGKSMAFCEATRSIP